MVPPMPVDYVGDVAGDRGRRRRECGRWIGCFEQYCKAQFAQERFGSRPQAGRPSHSEMAAESRSPFASGAMPPSAGFSSIRR